MRSIIVFVSHNIQGSYIFQKRCAPDSYCVAVDETLVIWLKNFFIVKFRKIGFPLSK